jgi:hypothetical protein
MPAVFSSLLFTASLDALRKKISAAEIFLQFFFAGNTLTFSASSSGSARNLPHSYLSRPPQTYGLRDSPSADVKSSLNECRKLRLDHKPGFDHKPGADQQNRGGERVVSKVKDTLWR